MQNFASINGNGRFVLTLNGTEAQSISFTSEKKDAIMFDFASLSTSTEFEKFFLPGVSVLIGITLQDYEPNNGETKDFRVNYAFAFNYYDTTPESVSSVLNYTVTQSFVDSALGAVAMKGKVFSYKLRL